VLPQQLIESTARVDLLLTDKGENSSMPAIIGLGGIMTGHESDAEKQILVQKLSELVQIPKIQSAHFEELFQLQEGRDMVLSESTAVNKGARRKVIVQPNKT